MWTVWNITNLMGPALLLVVGGYLMAKPWSGS